MFKKPYLPLRLQLFAEPEGTPEDTQAEETETEQTETKTFTQEDMDKAIADRLKRESGKTAKEVKELRSKLEAFENANKTDEEKAQAEAQAKEQALQEKDAELSTLRLQFEAVKNGVPEDKLEKFIKLAKLSDEEEFADKVAETLKDFPEFVAQQEESKAPKIVAGGNPNGTTNALTKEDFSKMGYAERMELFNTNPTLYNQLK